MKYRILTLACLITLATGAYHAERIALQDGEPLPVYVQIAGAKTMMDRREIFRITDAETWGDIWLRHTAQNQRRLGLLHPFPVIDFDACMVVAVFSGESWNSNGEAVESIAEFGDHIRLRFDSMTYQTAGEGGGGRRVTPYGLFIIPRSDKRLVVEENVQGLLGHPPQWEVQAEFDPIAE